MKLNKIGSLIIFIFISLTTYAQNDLGLLLGFSGSQVTGAQLSTTGFGGYNKLGLDAGFFIKHHLNESWSIESELKYIQKGFTNNSDNSRTNLQYFEIPVYFTRIISKNFEAELGLAAAYLFKSNFYSISTGDIPLYQPPGNHDFSAIAGITYVYSEHFSFNLKLSYSIVPIDHQAAYVTWQGDLGRYNNVLEFAVYYKL